MPNPSPYLLNRFSTYTLLRAAAGAALLGFGATVYAQQVVVEEFFVAEIGDEEFLVAESVDVEAGDDSGEGPETNDLHPAVYVLENLSVNDYLGRAISLLEDGRAEDALGLLVEQMALSGADTVGADNGVYQTVTRRVMSIVLQSPELQQEWEQQYGALAERQLEEALQARDIAEVLRLATEQQPTDAGYEAMACMAVVSLEAVNCEQALYWLYCMRQHSNAINDQERINLLSSYAYALLHRNNDWQAIREIANGATASEMDRFRMNLTGGLPMASSLVWRTNVSEYPISSYAFETMPLWTLSLMRNSLYSGRHQLLITDRLQAQIEAEPDGYLAENRVIHGLVQHDGDIYMHVGHGIMCIEALTGSQKWNKLLFGDCLSQQIGYYETRRPVLAGDNVIAILGGLPDNRSMSGAQYRYDYYSGVVNNFPYSDNTVMAACDAETGEAVWQVTATQLLLSALEAGPDDMSSAYGWEFTGSPYVQGDYIYAVATGLTYTSERRATGITQYMLAVHAKTGTLAWALLMPTHSISDKVIPQISVYSADGVLYVHNGIAAIYAIEGTTGDIQWYSILQKGLSGRNAAQSLELELDERAAFQENLLAPYGDTHLLCLTSLSAQGVIVLSRETGEVNDALTADLNEALSEPSSVYGTYMVDGQTRAFVVDNRIVLLNNDTLEVVMEKQFSGVVIADVVWLDDGVLLPLLNGVKLVSFDSEEDVKHVFGSPGRPVVTDGSLYMIESDFDRVFLHALQRWDGLRGDFLGGNITTAALHAAIKSADSEYLLDAIENHADQLDTQHVITLILCLSSGKKGTLSEAQQDALNIALQPLLDSDELKAWYAWSYGDMLQTRGQYQASADVLQGLLANPDLRSQVVQSTGASFFFYAKRSLANILEKQDVELAEDEAKKAFESLDSSSTDALFECLKAYPYCQASIDYMLAMAVEVSKWSQSDQARYEAFIMSLVEVGNTQAATALLDYYKAAQAFSKGAAFIIGLPSKGIERINFESQNLAMDELYQLWYAQYMAQSTVDFAQAEVLAGELLTPLNMQSHMSFDHIILWQDGSIMCHDSDQKLWQAENQAFPRHIAQRLSKEKPLIVGVFEQSVVLVNSDNIFALDLSSGELLWQKRLSEGDTLKEHTLVLQQTSYGVLRCKMTGDVTLLDAATGDSLWEQKLDYGVESVQIQATGELYCFGSPTPHTNMYGYLTTLELATGVPIHVEAISDNQAFYAVSGSYYNYPNIVMENGQLLQNITGAWTILTDDNGSPYDFNIHSDALASNMYGTWLLDATNQKELHVRSLESGIIGEGVAVYKEGLQSTRCGNHQLSWTNRSLTVSGLTGNIVWQVDVPEKLLNVFADIHAITVVGMNHTGIVLRRYAIYTGELLSRNEISIQGISDMHEPYVQFYEDGHVCLTLSGQTIRIKSQ